LALLLHGAGGHAHQGLALLQHLADHNRMILVAPASAAQTWDVIAGYAYALRT
jgi:phospholipase/carboxylesterase